MVGIERYQSRLVLLACASFAGLFFVENDLRFCRCLASFALADAHFVGLWNTVGEDFYFNLKPRSFVVEIKLLTNFVFAY